jgi:hypothetical protein
MNSKWPSKSVTVVRGEEPGNVDVSFTVIPERMSVPFSPVDEVTFPLIDPEAGCAVFAGCCPNARIAQTRIAISKAAPRDFLMQSFPAQRTFNGTFHTFGKKHLTWQSRFEARDSRAMRLAQINSHASCVLRNSEFGRGS